MDSRWQTMALQLVALRAVVGALQAQIEALQDGLEGIMIDAQPPEPVCRHEHRRVVDTVGITSNSLGDPVWQCQACGAIVEAPE